MTDTHIPADRRPETFEEPPPEGRPSNPLNPWLVGLVVVSIVLIFSGALIAYYAGSAAAPVGLAFVAAGLVGLLLSMAAKAILWKVPTD